MFSKPNGLGSSGVQYKGNYEIIPSTSDIIIPKNTVFKNDFIIKGDTDLTPANIKDGVTIFNVTGILKEKQLEDYTWSEINDIVSQGLQEVKFSLHDTKTFTVGSETVTVEIADFNHDDKSDGSGKAGISFILKNCMNTKHNMNPTDTNVNGWSGSAMYSYLNTDIYNQLPSDLQSVIKPVNKITSEGNQSTTLQTSSDKLWLMSRVEVFGGSKPSYTPDGEGIQYPIFTDNANRIKQVNGSNSYYWLRSPRVDSSRLFCYILDDGYLFDGNASNSRGVVFGFCI